MATQISDQLGSVRVTNGTVVRNILKSHISEISVVKADIIKIDIGRGALRNVYIAFSTVDDPVFGDIVQLRDWLLSICQLTVNVSGNNSSTQANLLQQISVNTSVMSFLMEIFENPILKDESNPNCIYEGFGNIGSDPANPSWAIRRIKLVNDTIRVQWPNGGRNLNNRWTDRETLNYL